MTTKTTTNYFVKGSNRGGVLSLLVVRDSLRSNGIMFAPLVAGKASFLASTDSPKVTASRNGSVKDGFGLLRFLAFREARESNRLRIKLFTALLFALFLGQAPGFGAFVESGGTVVMEAEHFSSTTAASAHAWTVTNGVAGFVGAAAMQATPNIGVTISSSVPTTSPALKYQVQFTQAGTYKLWIRGWGAGGSDDSVYVSLDGQLPQSLSYSPAGVWMWRAGQVTVADAGLHEVNVWMREDGAYVDRLLLTTNATFIPTGDGPSESAQSGATTNPPVVQITAPANGASFPSGTTVSVTANASDPDGSVVVVDFYVNGGLFMHDTNAPFGFDWTSTTGNYRLTAIATDDAGNFTASPAVGVSVAAALPTSGGFTESGGFVVMEAEHFHGSTSASGHAWVPTNNITGFVGESAMQAAPNSGMTISANIPTTSPMLRYTVQFTNSGDYRLWLRGWAASGSDDSVYLGVDGQLAGTLSYSPTAAWMWRAIPVNISTPGSHEINLWMREDGAYVDRLLLTANPAYTPVGDGPPETVFRVQITAPSQDASFMAGGVVPINATVTSSDNSGVTVMFYINGSLAATDTNPPFSFNWIPAPGDHQLFATAANSGNIATSTVVSVTVTSPPVATFRYAASSARIYVEGGGVATLSDIKAALPNAPLTLVNPSNHIWLLDANIVVAEGSTLRLYGSAVGGDVNELYLKSNNFSTSNSFVSLDADWGTLDLNRVRVSSWDELALTPDAEYATYGRAFIRARSRLVGAVAQQSTLNVVDSDISHLGFNASDGSALTWQVIGSVPGVKVSGNVSGSHIHNCMVGVSSWAVDDVNWIGNEIAFNTIYGFDADDPGHQAVLANNNVHDNNYSAVFRWANSSQRIYVTGPGNATLSDIKAAVPNAPLTLVDPTNAVWHLGAHLFVEKGARLQLYGPAIGGDVAELRLKSDNTSATNAIIEIRADWGWLDIRNTKITSWDSAVNGPDTETEAYRRAYIRARSTLDPDGVTAHESRMDIINSEICYLGSQNTEAYGLTWKVVDTTAVYLPLGTTNTLFDLVNVYGDIINSRIHHNHFGVYTYGHHGGHWATNEVDHNIRYGFDPHDDSDHLVIEGNNVHHNGWHGIIASKRCDHGVMRNNRSWNNGLDLINPHGHGIMLHRSCNDWLVEGNQSYGNADTGIALFACDSTLVRNNICIGNTNAGIRLNVGSANNWVEGNEVSGPHRNGLYLFVGDDPPEPDVDGGLGSGRCHHNTFTNNFVRDCTSDSIKVNSADNNAFLGNVIVGNNATLRFDGGTNNLMVGNLLPVNAFTKLVGATTNRSSVIFKSQLRIVMQLDAFSTATFADDEGAIFDFEPSEVTTVVDSAGSFAMANAARVGIGANTVLTRNLFVTPSSGGVLVNPTLWELSSNRNKAWTAQASPGSIQIRYVVGDLVPDRLYEVRRGSSSLTIIRSDNQGYISFTTNPGTTAALNYSVRRVAGLSSALPLDLPLDLPGNPLDEIPDTLNSEHP